MLPVAMITDYPFDLVKRPQLNVFFISCIDYGASSQHTVTKTKTYTVLSNVYTHSLFVDCDGLNENGERLGGVLLLEKVCD